MFEQLQNIPKLLAGQRKTKKGKQVLSITMLMYSYPILWNRVKSVISGNSIA